MARYLVSILFILLVITGAAALFFPGWWTHRYDDLITRQARVYRLDDHLVWSLIYQETYFRAWKIGAAEEVGLMQVTPTVAREWAHETGLKEYERQVNENVDQFLADPERNLQAGCWYLERLRDQYRGRTAETAMMLAAYNAGASRVDEWTQGADPAAMTEADFISRIDYPSTRAYVSDILTRYRKEQTR